MDDMQEIESRIQATEQSVPAVVADENEISSAPVAVALDDTVGKIVSKAHDRINSESNIDKQSRALEKTAKARIANEIEKQNVENEKKRAANEIDRKTLANKLYEIKETNKRLKKEQKHLSRMQKSAHKAADAHAYWEQHKDTLEQYKMHEGSSRIACNILLFLDGIKCFFIGLSKLSDALVKALKWLLVFALITTVFMVIPALREWTLKLLGFIK